MTFKIEVEQEDDGRWLAEVLDLAGVVAYGATREEAIRLVEALALRAIADRLEDGAEVPPMNGVFSVEPTTETARRLIAAVEAEPHLTPDDIQALEDAIAAGRRPRSHVDDLSPGPR